MPYKYKLTERHGNQSSGLYRLNS
uniref:Uncharacterized protein n=1 Tax=Arundo donax TaxID=35708 RepID=A0A0A9E9W4_ARUDO